MKFLRTLGAKSAEVERAAGVPRHQYGKPYVPRSKHARDVERAIASTYDRTTWVFRCVQAIAYNQAKLTMLVRADDPKRGEAIPGHPLLPLLNYRANPLEGSFAYRARLSAQLLLSARGAFVEMVRNNGGDVTALHLLPPQSTRAIPDPDLFVSGYEVTIDNRKTVVEPENVLWLRNPHPTDPYRSMTAIEAAGIAIDADYLAHLYNVNFLQNDGRPGGIVNVRGQLLPTDADELKSYFRGGAGKAGEWRVIESEGIEVEDMATTPRDAQYVEMRNQGKEEVLIAFGVPETILGNASGRTFDNADAEREVFWHETMLPHLELIGSALDAADENPGTFVGYDLADVQPLQRAERERRQELRDEFEAGLITVDEYREGTGRDTFDEPGSQSLWGPFSTQAIAGPAAVGGGSAPDNAEVIDVDAEDDQPAITRGSSGAPEEVHAGRKVGPFRAIEGGAGPG